MSNRAPITVDGKLIGYVSLSWSQEIPLGSGLPPSVGLGATPYSPGAARALSRSGSGPAHHRSLGGDHGSHVAPHPRRTLGGHTGEHHERHLDPHNRTAETEKAPHLTTADVAGAVHGKAEPTFPNVTRGNGGVDRSSIAKELEGNEALQRRYAQMVVGEIYYDRASERAKIVQAETAANRALIRGHNLDQALWLHGSGRDNLGGVGHGEAGYYPATTFNRGMTEAQWQDFKQNILPKVLAGSNEAGGFTGNASLGVAERQKRLGTPTIDLRGEGGDQYFNEGPFTNPLPRLPAGTTSTGFDAGGKPTGVTQLGTGGANVGPVANPSAPGKLGTAPGYHPDLASVDPRLTEILGAGKNHFENLHPGYQVAATSGHRANDGPHGTREGAVDLQIIDPSGQHCRTAARIALVCIRS